MASLTLFSSNAISFSSSCCLKITNICPSSRICFASSSGSRTCFVLIFMPGLLSASPITGLSSSLSLTVLAEYVTSALCTPVRISHAKRKGQRDWVSGATRHYVLNNATPPFPLIQRGTVRRFHILVIRLTPAETTSNYHFHEIRKVHCALWPSVCHPPSHSSPFNASLPQQLSNLLTRQHTRLFRGGHLESFVYLVCACVGRHMCACASFLRHFAPHDVICMHRIPIS